MQITTNNLMSLSSDTIKNQKTNYKSRYKSNPDYSNPETCSIDIDVKILKRMMNDSDFEMKIKGMISTRESNYDTYVNDAMNSTYGFGHIFIQEEKGELVTGFALYHFKASTDEEIKLMYADKSKDYTKNQQSIHIVKNST